jgi:PAS domain S-box-containing protein
VEVLTQRISGLRRGRASLRNCRGGGWELILADYSLPSFSGGEALKLLNESGEDVPFIVISGLITDEMAVKLLRSGAKDFILKTNLVRLAPAVQRELDEASVRRKQRLLEQELKEKEDLHRTILENSPSPISITVEGKIVYANPSRLRLTGASSLEEIIGQDWSQYIHPDDLDYVQTRNRAFEEGKPVPEKYEYRCLRSDGSYANIEAVSARVTYRGRPALLYVLHDVTHHKEFEARLTGLHGYARDLAAAETLGEAALVVGDVVQRLLKTNDVGVGLVEDRVLRFKYLYGNEFSERSAMPLDGPGISARAARSGEPQIVPDVRLDGDFVAPLGVDAETRSEVTLPIKINDEVVAVINIEHPNVDEYTGNDVRLLEMLGNHFSSAVQRIRASEALRASEERYRSFLDNLQDAVIVLDNDTYLYANRATAELLGYDSPEDIIGLPSRSLVAPEDREVVRQRMEVRARGEDAPSRYELSLLRRDGGVVPVEVNVSRIMYMGKPASLAVHRDITKRRQMEENARIHLKESERSALLLENISDSVIVTNLEGIISYWNPGATSIFGYSSEEMIGKSITLLNMSEEKGDVADLQLENIRGGESHPQEWRGVRKDGSVVWLLLHSKLLKSSDGVPVDMIGVGKDVTQRKQMEEEGKRYRSRLELLYELDLQLDTAQTPTQTAEIARNMIQSLSGLEHARLALVEGEALVAVMNPRSNPKITRLPLNGRGVTVQAVREKRTIYVGDTEKDPNFVKGGIDALSELVMPLRAQGEVVGVLDIESTRRNAFTPEDIKLAETVALHVSGTLERMRLAEEHQHTLEAALREEADAEQARILAAVKTRFYSSATHEIRTPLTSIRGYTELIQGALQSGDTSQLPAYFDAVMRNAERLTRLTDDLLDTQRIEENRLMISRSPVKTGDLLRDLGLEATPGLTRRGQTLEVRGELDVTISVDRDRLIQVLANLVGNASKFSPEGSTIRLSVERRGGEVLFTVRDEGVGLTEGDVPKLFNPFPGIHVNGNTEGTGLGLNISKGIVELHGGRIWAESGGPGMGSTFSFTIPVVEP